MRGCGAHGRGWVGGVDLQFSFKKATICDEGGRKKSKLLRKDARRRLDPSPAGTHITAAAYYAITARYKPLPSASSEWVGA